VHPPSVSEDGASIVRAATLAVQDPNPTAAEGAWCDCGEASPRGCHTAASPTQAVVDSPLLQHPRPCQGSNLRASPRMPATYTMSLRGCTHTDGWHVARHMPEGTIDQRPLTLSECNPVLPTTTTTKKGGGVNRGLMMSRAHHAKRAGRVSGGRH
jgi:hypothetical protein